MSQPGLYSISLPNDQTLDLTENDVTLDDDGNLVFLKVEEMQSLFQNVVGMPCDNENCNTPFTREDLDESRVYWHPSKKMQDKKSNSHDEFYIVRKAAHLKHKDCIDPDQYKCGVRDLFKNSCPVSNEEYCPINEIDQPQHSAPKSTKPDDDDEKQPSTEHADVEAATSSTALLASAQMAQRSKRECRTSAIIYVCSAIFAAIASGGTLWRIY